MQTWDTHTAWFHNFTEYTQGGECWASPPSFPGQLPSSVHPATLIWVTSPCLYGPIWPPTQTYVKAQNALNYNRALRYSLWAHEYMRAMGARTVNALAMTQAMWESVWDGVHYAAPEELRKGNVAKMMAQVVMNTIFPDCGKQ